MVILVGLAIDQIAQSGLSSLSVIYYSAQLFRENEPFSTPGLSEKNAYSGCATGSSFIWCVKQRC
ncbi:hypothetical protein DN591_24825 [Citrobacter freundii]|nr:hypothetical protein DN591_24825 [Citrobacter freundii]